MAGQYSFSPLRYIYLAVFFAACLTGWCLPARSGDNPLYTVEGVKVDVTAANAAAAREQAFNQAQQLAFQQLAQRLEPDQAKNIQAPPPDDIATMVDDFEITNEQLSTVRYIGTYTFRFKPGAIRSYLSLKGAEPPSEASSGDSAPAGNRQILVLPYFQWGSHSLLWNENNPWLSAWRRGGAGPAVLPLGDAQDFANMKDDHALDFDPQQLQAMTARYNAGSAAIVIATPQSAANAEPASLVIAIYRTKQGSPHLAATLQVADTDKNPGETIYDAGARKARSALFGNPKSKAAEDTAAAADKTPAAPAGSSLMARVRFASMQEWVQTQRALRIVPGIDDVKLVSLKPDEALVAIRYEGPESQLRTALQQSAMTLGAGMGGPGSGGPTDIVYDLVVNQAATPPVPAYR